MNELINMESSDDFQCFYFNSKPIRIILVEGEPWFVAKDVADALEYSWAGSATIKHVPPEWKGSIPF